MNKSVYEDTQPDVLFTKKWHFKVLAIIYGTLALAYILLRIFI